MTNSNSCLLTDRPSRDSINSKMEKTIAGFYSTFELSWMPERFRIYTNEFLTRRYTLVRGKFKVEDCGHYLKFSQVVGLTSYYMNKPQVVHLKGIELLSKNSQKLLCKLIQSEGIESERCRQKAIELLLWSGGHIEVYLHSSSSQLVSERCRLRLF